MASVILRQDVESYWNDLNPDSKLYIMNNVIHKMVISDNLQVISNFEDIVFQIAIDEFPKTWPNALSIIGEYLIKDEPSALYGGLCALRSIVKRYKNHTWS